LKGEKRGGTETGEGGKGKGVRRGNFASKAVASTIRRGRFKRSEREYGRREMGGGEETVRGDGDWQSKTAWGRLSDRVRNEKLRIRTASQKGKKRPCSSPPKGKRGKKSPCRKDRGQYFEIKAKRKRKREKAREVG